VPKSFEPLIDERIQEGMIPTKTKKKKKDKKDKRDKMEGGPKICQRGTPRSKAKPEVKPEPNVVVAPPCSTFSAARAPGGQQQSLAQPRTWAVNTVSGVAHVHKPNTAYSVCGKYRCGESGSPCSGALFCPDASGFTVCTRCTGRKPS
jgi:hypothetical protein